MKAWVFGVGFYDVDTADPGRMMLFYQEHSIQDEIEETEKLLQEAEGDIEEEYDSYVADLNNKVKVAMTRSHSSSSSTTMNMMVAEAYSNSAWQQQMQQQHMQQQHMQQQHMQQQHMQMQPQE